MRVFTRQLGSQAGVQLNALKDGTDGFAIGAFDQTAAVVGRFKRGRTDKPFWVNRNNLAVMLGTAESISINALNECYTQIYECLQRGAKQVLVQRLTTPAASTLWAVATLSGATTTFAASAAQPVSGFSFAIKHLGCFNDGLKINFHADKKTVSGVVVASPVIKLRITDAKDVNIYPEIIGSLDATAQDEYGESFFIGDVAAKYAGTTLEFVVATGAAVATTSDAYGKDVNGLDKWATTGVSPLICFSEGGTAYTNADYDKAVTALRDTEYDFGYIFSGGTRALSLIAKLGDLAYDTNRQFIYDVPSEYTPTAIAAFQASLGWGTLGKDHYPQAYWTPIKAYDPINGNIIAFGSGGAQVGYRCARNADTNSYGFAAKNYPVAFKDYALGRVNMTQIYTPSEQDLSDIADAKVNPVIYKPFNGGNKVVFADVLTCAATVVSYRKLVTVAEITSHLSEMVARYANECLGLPMQIGISRMETFLKTMLDAALASGWITEPTSPKDKGKPAYAYVVEPDQVRSADLMRVSFSVHPDGVVRQVHITPKLY